MTTDAQSTQSESAQKPEPLTQSTLFDFLVKDDSITWQQVLTEAVKAGNIDPWDVDITKLAEQFLKLLNEFQELNFTISGKVVLAAAILLKLKSARFLEDDVNQLDSLIADSQQPDYDEDDTDYEDLDSYYAEHGQHPNNPNAVSHEDMTLYPRTPQPRKRKVSMYDLVDALEKALEVKNRRRVLDQVPAPTIKAPQNLVDISELITEMTDKVIQHFNQSNQQPLLFSKLVPEPTRHAKMYTFMPLLYMSNNRTVDLKQEKEFEEFSIHPPAQEQAEPKQEKQDKNSKT